MNIRADKQERTNILGLVIIFTFSMIARAVEKWQKVLWLTFAMVYICQCNVRVYLDMKRIHEKPDSAETEDYEAFVLKSLSQKKTS